jgi:pimeloyl-ACP methyl ester carboxylesterase
MVESLIIEEIEFQLNDIKLHGIGCGHNNEPIVLCLHGWLDNAASFIPLMSHFSGYRVIAIDWPGHGWSEHRQPGAYYHFVDWISDLVSLFELNKWHNIHIVAHSMGAMVASAFSAAFPKKVASLTLIDAFAFNIENAENMTKQLKRGLRSRQLLMRRAPSSYATFEEALNVRLMATDLDESNTSLIIKRGLNLINKRFFWRFDPRLKLTSPYRFTPEQALQLLSDIVTPMQVVIGEQGAEKAKLMLSRYQYLFPNLLTHQLVGGHHVHMEQAKKTAKIAMEFIKNNNV